MMEGKGRELSLEEILESVVETYRETLSFSRDAPDLRTVVESLTVVAISINYLVIHDFGGRLGPVRIPGMVEQVVAAAFQTYGDYDPHPSPFDKAAMLLRGITQGHPFNDGNKRTGFTLASYYLDRSGYPVPDTLSRRQVVSFCRQISSGRIKNPKTIARRLAKYWRVDLRTADSETPPTPTV